MLDYFRRQWLAVHTASFDKLIEHLLDPHGLKDLHCDVAEQRFAYSPWSAYAARVLACQ